MKEFINSKVTLKVPSRIHLGVLDIDRLGPGRFGGGGIGIAIDMQSFLEVSIIASDKDIIISSHNLVIKHMLDVMRSLLNIF